MRRILRDLFIEGYITVRAATAETHVYRTESDPWSFEFKDGIVCKAEVIPPNPRKDLNWSLAGLYSQEDVDRQPLLARRLADELIRRDVRRAYAPSVAAHSARIVGREELTTCMKLPGGVLLYRNKDLPADGVPIRRKEAFIMSGAGCPPIIIAGKGHCIPVHGSRQSLIDVERASDEHRTPSREYESVIHAAVAFLRERHKVQPHHLALRGGLHIAPDLFEHPFSHPKLAIQNLALYDYLCDEYDAFTAMQSTKGHLDLADLAMRIALKLGFPEKRVSFAPPLPEEAVTTRNEPEYPGGPWRNLVIVYRTQ